MHNICDGVCLDDGIDEPEVTEVGMKTDSLSALFRIARCAPVNRLVTRMLQVSTDCSSGTGSVLLFE